MPTLHPGLYIRDTTSPAERPVRLASTSVAAFVGVTQKGPVATATLITSWSQFVRTFGTYLTGEYYLAYAVRAFFANGGTRCYVTRVVHFSGDPSAKSSTPATHTFTDGAGEPTNVLTVTASSDGDWGESISVGITNNTTTFDVEVKYGTVVMEKFFKQTMATIANNINGVSEYITVTVLDATKLPATAASTALTSGDNGLTGIADADYVGTSVTMHGLYSFDGLDINMVAVPGVTTSTVHAGLITYASTRGDCIAILDSVKAATVSATIATKTALTASDYAAFYFPWVVIADPIGTGVNPQRTVPPSGFVAGIYARIDNARGVWKAPAGTETALVDVIRLERAVSDVDQDSLNPEGVNCLRTFPNVGTISWSDRTMSGLYINHIRLKLFIKKTFQSSFAWVVFEPIDSAILGPTGSVESSGNAFMRGLYQKGAFDDEVAEPDAYHVLCRRDNNPTSQTNAGQLNIQVAYKNKGVAEFVTIDIGLKR